MFENIVNIFENITTVFQYSPWLFYSTVLLFGLCVGSFINVVVYRLPLMMERDWKRECHEFLELEQPKFEQPLSSLNLATPASACPIAGMFCTFGKTYLFLVIYF